MNSQDDVPRTAAVDLVRVGTTSKRDSEDHLFGYFLPEIK